MKQNKLTSSRQSRKKNISDAYDAFKMATLHKKPRKNCRMESWEDCIILLWLGTIYPGCQRLFMGGFRFRSSLKKCWSPVDETKLPDAREKKPLVPRVRCILRVGKNKKTTENQWWRLTVI